MKNVSSTILATVTVFSGGAFAQEKPPAEQVEAQRANAQKLVADLKAIQEKSEVTQEMKNTLFNDLMALYGTLKPPSQESVKKLAADLARALDDGNLSSDDLAKLADDMIGVMTSTGMTEEQAAKILQDMASILKASNIKKADVQQIVSDAKTIWKTRQQGKAK